MPYITNSRSVFGRLEDDHHRPFSDPKEHKDETPTPSPAPGRRRLPLLQRPPVSSITTTTRSKDPDQRSTVNTISTKETDVCRGGNSLNNEIRRAQVFQHLRKERGEFVSNTPPTRRRLGDNLEGLQVQQVVDITTLTSATAPHVPTAVTASAGTKRRDPEELAAIATMAAMNKSKRRRNDTSTTNISTP